MKVIKFKSLYLTYPFRTFLVLLFCLVTTIGNSQKKNFSKKVIANTTQLILEMNDLTAFPENYCNLINVEKIYISYNDISSLPDCLIQMTKLKQVMMTDNDFTVFPEILCSIPTITVIGLHGNNIK